MKNLSAMHLKKVFNTFLMAGCLLLTVTANGQTQKAFQIAYDYLQTHQLELGLSDLDISDLVVSDLYTDAHSGITHLYLQQQFQGIAIKDAIAGIHFDESGKVIHMGNRLDKKLSQRVATKSLSLSSIDAVRAAANALEIAVQGKLEVLEEKKSASKETLISKANISINAIPVKLIYHKDDKGALRLVWEVQIYSRGAQNYWLVYVDASTGSIVSTQDLVIKCTFDHHHKVDCTSEISINKTGVGVAEPLFMAKENTAIQTATAGNFYRVYDAPVETPNHGGRSLVFTNGDPVASPFGWHNDGTLSYNVTKGNNVYAYEDQLGVNAGLPTLGGISPFAPLNFDFPINLNDQPGTYKDAAVTNLFYWNNLVHDVFYHYGFTESAGNFQMDNRGMGGLGNDGVMAEAQDGGGTNNANFLTLPDGLPGRMQMYLWSSNAPAELVFIESSSSYPSGGVAFTALQAAFGADITESPVTGELVIVEANSNAQVGCNSCGCGTNQGVGLPPNNNVQGKIVLIDRGDCSFIEKVMGAQMGGAIGVIVANNTPGTGAISMGGDETGATILIPAVMVSYEDGLELKDEIALGSVTTSLKRLVPASPMKDGDLDNGIIVHEYGHGISTRLTGGPSQTCLSGDEQAGEGWSDFFALMMTMNQQNIADGGFAGRGIGTYVFDEPITGLGIRPARYSRDFGVNPYTYGDINNAEITVPHGIGFVFATALWEMTWNLIDVYGYNPDLVNGSINNGNILALQLVMDGLKLQPCGPTFLESRDAILAADQALTGGANQCLIWEAFAKRGMGYSAISGTNARGDEIEAFDMPPSCLPDLVMTKTADQNEVENGGTITYTLSVSNVGGEMATGVVVTDPIPSGTTYVGGSASNGGYPVAGVVTYPATNIAPGQTFQYTFDVVVNTSGESIITFDDNMEDGLGNWSAPIGLNSWQLQNAAANSGNFSWFAADPDNASNQILQFANSITVPANAELRFFHKYDTESGFDGGRVEISTDGLVWYDLGPQMIQNGYTDFIPAANNPLINGTAFGGSSNGWIETAIDLSIFSGQTVDIRFRFSSDVATSGDGWYIDDVTIGQNLTFVSNTAYFTSPLETGMASARTTVLAPGTQQRGAEVGSPEIHDNTMTNTAALQEELRVITFPNPATELLNLAIEGQLVGNADVKLMDVNGKVMRSIAVDTESPRHELQMMVSDLPTGMYLVVLQDEVQVTTHRVLIDN